MKRPFFSIIIPTHNRRLLLRKAIDSVLTQRYDNFELIIVDDGSTDDTLSYIQAIRDDRLKYYFQENSGKSRARNKGITLSSGEYICFLDSDDYYYENHLDSIYNLLILNEFPVAMVRTGMSTYKNGIVQSHTQYYTDSDYSNPVYFFMLNSIGTNTVCIHNKITEYFLFDERWDYFQDSHFFIRVMTKFPFYEIRELTCACRVHSKRSSFTIFLSEDAEGRTINNILAITNLFDEYGEIIKPLVPTWMEDYLLCHKYMDHATAYQAAGKLRLAWKCFIKAIQQDKRGWGMNRYLRFLPKFPLKVFFDYPSLPKNDA